MTKEGLPKLLDIIEKTEKIRVIKQTVSGIEFKYGQLTCFASFPWWPDSEKISIEIKKPNLVTSSLENYIMQEVVGKIKPPKGISSISYSSSPEPSNCGVSVTLEKTDITPALRVIDEILDKSGNALIKLADYAISK